MHKFLTAASIALLLGAAPLARAADDIVIVEVKPVSTDLASHLKVSPANLPPQVDMPGKLAAVVCNVTLKQLRDGGGRCVAVNMSQGLIQAVRQAMRGG